MTTKKTYRMTVVFDAPDELETIDKALKIINDKNSQTLELSAILKRANFVKAVALKYSKEIIHQNA